MVRRESMVLEPEMLLSLAELPKTALDNQKVRPRNYCGLPFCLMK